MYWSTGPFFGPLHRKLFSLYISDKITAWVTSSCSTICWEKVEYMLSIIDNNNIRMYIATHYVATFCLVIFSYETSSPTTVFTSTGCQSFSSFENVFYLSTRFLSFKPWTAESCVSLPFCYRVSEFPDAVNAAYHEWMNKVKHMISDVSRVLLGKSLWHNMPWRKHKGLPPRSWGI